MSPARRALALGLALAGALGLLASIGAGADHAALRFTGVFALASLVLTLLATPIGLLVGGERGLALRAARRGLGIGSAVAALAHASLAVAAYLPSWSFAPLARLPWMRHGALAVALLLPLLVTSFPAVQRALRVRAWSALHRLAYAAGLLGCLHSVEVPYGNPTLGLVAAAIVALSLLARVLLPLRRRRSPDPE
ncbi:MAG: ferric reductase-like transmembrane domain-containing protein [Sandaracinus sp.]